MTINSQPGGGDDASTINVEGDDGDASTDAEGDDTLIIDAEAYDPSTEYDALLIEV